MPGFISSIGTSVPQFATHQRDIASFMIDRLELDPEEATNLKILYRASGIQTRYSVLPDFQQNGHDPFFKDGDVMLKPSVGSRMKLYQKEAVVLAETALKNAIAKVDLPVSDITHLITVSCTGMFAPGLDISLVEKLGLNTHVERTNINFMGCYAAFNAIKAARYIVESNTSAKVAVVCVELCSIHFQDKTDEDTLLANALFGDGAAALIMTSGGHAGLELEIMDNYSDLSLIAKDEMTWNIGDNGFDMKLSGNVPDVIKSGIHDLTHKLLNRKNLDLSHVDYFAIHPGGKRILEVIEEELGIAKEDNAPATEVLKTYGNMSSPTVLFVLNNILENISNADHDKKILSFAFGPGLTMESMIYNITANHA